MALSFQLRDGPNQPNHSKAGKTKMIHLVQSNQGQFAQVPELRLNQPGSTPIHIDTPWTGWFESVWHTIGSIVKSKDFKGAALKCEQLFYILQSTIFIQLLFDVK